MRIKRFLSLALTAITMLSMVSFAGCKDNKTEGNEVEDNNPAKIVTLANFEQFDPDFQLLRLRKGFGAVNVNQNKDYVKSGESSAKLQPLGRYKDKAKPFLYFELESELYDYSYADLDYLYSISMWLYNDSEEQKEAEIGIVTSFINLNEINSDGVTQGAGISYKLNSGWNKLTYFIDKSEVYLPSGGTKAQGIYLQFENTPSRDIEDAPVFYLDDVVLTVKKEFNEISVAEPTTCFKQGDTIAIPKATIRGGEVSASVYNSGKQVATQQNSFVANSSGEYIITYQAMVDGFLYKKNVKLFVKSPNALEIIDFDQASDMDNFLSVAVIEKTEWMQSYAGETGVAKVTINRDWPRFWFKPAHSMAEYEGCEYLYIRMYVPTGVNQLTWLNLCDSALPEGYAGYIIADKWVTYKFPIEPFLSKGLSGYFVGNSTSYTYQGEIYIADVFAM